MGKNKDPMKTKYFSHGKNFFLFWTLNKGSNKKTKKWVIQSFMKSKDQKGLCIQETQNG